MPIRIQLMRMLAACAYTMQIVRMLPACPYASYVVNRCECRLDKSSALGYNGTEFKTGSKTGKRTSRKRPAFRELPEGARQRQGFFELILESFLRKEAFGSLFQAGKQVRVAGSGQRRYTHRACGNRFPQSRVVPRRNRLSRLYTGTGEPFLCALFLKEETNGTGL